jgi:membrane protease YdiL (CAAX protease family)
LAPTRSDRPFTLAAAALWASALWLFEHVCFDATESFRPGAITDIVSVSACVVLATSAMVFAMVRVHAPDQSLRATLGIRPVAPWKLLLAAAAGAGLSPALSTVDDLIARRWPYDDPDAAESMQKLLSSASRLALVVCVFVVIPLAREVFFRGIVFTELRRPFSGRDAGDGGNKEGVSTGVAVAATTILFGVFSLDWRSIPTALVLGLALGWLRARTGSLVAPMVTHLAFWSVQGIPILQGADPSADFAFPPGWIAGGAIGAVLALALAALPAPARS